MIITLDFDCKNPDKNLDIIRRELIARNFCLHHSAKIGKDEYQLIGSQETVEQAIHRMREHSDIFRIVQSKRTTLDEILFCAEFHPEIIDPFSFSVMSDAEKIKAVMFYLKEKDHENLKEWATGQK